MFFFWDLRILLVVLGFMHSDGHILTSTAASSFSGAVPATGSGGAGACGVSTQVSCVKALVHFVSLVAQYCKL